MAVALTEPPCCTGLPQASTKVVATPQAFSMTSPGLIVVTAYV